ncbi:hypothetical protein [Hymenobacter sp. 102]|uniref:hypothetical protein n=1 Tax=Hymenobacter sp. 102 TaxID=3403152 RepID=UPI003CE74BDF
MLAIYLFSKFLARPLLLKAVSNTPAALITKLMDSTRVSPRITDRTGRIQKRDFKMAKMSPKRDTLVFRYLMHGPRADATVKLRMVRRPSGQWDMTTLDTLFSAPAPPKQASKR